MARKGPAPTPGAILKFRGSWRGKRRSAQPEPGTGAPECPAWMDDVGRAEWQRIVPELERRGVLWRVDGATLEGYCWSYSTWRKADGWIKQNGTVMVLRNDKGEVKSALTAPQVGIAMKALDSLRRFAVEFGLTPASRQRVSKVEPPADNDKARFFAKGG